MIRNIAPLNTKQLKILNQFLSTQEKSIKTKIRSKFKGEGPKDSTENHYVYEQEEEPVINDLKKDFNELNNKLSKLNDFNGGDIDAFRTLS